LLLPRFAELARARFEFFLQLCSGFANAANVSSRLRCLRTKTGNARSALRPFARQGHLVGSAQPRIEPINPNRTARGTRGVSLDHLVGAGEHCRRAEGLTTSPPAQRAHCRVRRHRIPPRLQARFRGYRVEAARLALHFWPVTALDQEQEPGCASGEARGRRGLGTVTRHEHLADVPDAP
jgi:hypothetical protein